MSDSKSSATNGIGFLGALFIVFLVLKLCNVITWSWWWITAPIWGGIALRIIIALLYAAVMVIMAKMVKRKWKM